MSAAVKPWAASALRTGSKNPVGSPHVVGVGHVVKVLAPFANTTTERRFAVSPIDAVPLYVYEPIDAVIVIAPLRFDVTVTVRCPLASVVNGFVVNFSAPVPGVA